MRTAHFLPAHNIQSLEMQRFTMLPEPTIFGGSAKPLYKAVQSLDRNWCLDPPCQFGQPTHPSSRLQLELDQSL